MGICEYGPDVLFVHHGKVFFGLAECCVSECSEDIEASLSLSVYVVSMWVEQHGSVVCHSECASCVGVGYGCVVECVSRFQAEVGNVQIIYFLIKSAGR